MTRRVLAAAFAAVLLPSVAEAAPRQVCRILGPSGPATVDAPNDALAIASADIASDHRHVTAAIRVRTLADPQAAVTGRAFTFYFSRGVEENYAMSVVLWGDKADTPYLLEYDMPFAPEKNDVQVKQIRWTGPTPAYVLDTARNEVRLTVPMAAFRQRKGSQTKPGATVSYLAAETTRIYGVSRSTAPFPAGVPSELGTGGRWTYGLDRVSYTLGTPSCVPVGR